MDTNTATGLPRNGNRRDFVLPVRLRRATVKPPLVLAQHSSSLAIFAAIRVSSFVSSLLPRCVAPVAGNKGGAPGPRARDAFNRITRAQRQAYVKCTPALGQGEQPPRSTSSVF